MKGGRCDTCVFVEECSVYKAVRETQIFHVAPTDFGCIWHMDESKHCALDSKPKEATDALPT